MAKKKDEPYFTKIRCKIGGKEVTNEEAKEYLAKKVYKITKTIKEEEAV